MFNALFFLLFAKDGLVSTLCFFLFAKESRVLTLWGPRALSSARAARAAQPRFTRGVSKARVVQALCPVQCVRGRRAFVALGRGKGHRSRRPTVFRPLPENSDKGRDEKIRGVVCGLLLSSAPVFGKRMARACFCLWRIKPCSKRGKASACKRTCFIKALCCFCV